MATVVACRARRARLFWGDASGLQFVFATQRGCINSRHAACRRSVMPLLVHSPLAYWVHDLNPFIIRFNEHFGIRY